MKPWTLICAVLLSVFFSAGVSAATNRTILLGQIDSVADSSFISLLDSSPTEKAVRLPVRMHATEPFTGRSITTEKMESTVVAPPKGDHFESYLMLGLTVGLIAVHLRRKQKSLRHRPLAEVMYR